MNSEQTSPSPPVDHIVMPGLAYCHLCGDSEIEWDLESCYECGKWTCPECGVEVETEDGDPLGILCGECDGKN